MSAEAGYRWKIALILLGAFGLYLLGNKRVGLWDRDEPRYAECSREMLRSGDWVVMTFLGKWRPQKPPMIHWCQATAMAVLGEKAEAARLPSAIAVTLGVLLLAAVVWRFAGAQRAVWSALIFATSVVAIAAAKFCITDAMMTLFVTAGQVCLAVMWASERAGRRTPWWTAPVFWVSIGLAGLTKGPQVLGMHLVTLIALAALDVGRSWRSGRAWIGAMRWWKRTQPLIGLPILAAVVAPWLILVHRRAPGFLASTIYQAQRHAASATEGHGGPPGYHLVLIFATFFPWSLLLPTTIGLAWRHRAEPAIRFAIAAAVGPWLLMEFVKTKLPFYILPSFPPLAFLTADALVRCLRGEHDDLLRRAFLIGAAGWALAVLALAGAPWVLVRWTHELPWAAMIAYSAAAVLYAGVVMARFSAKRMASGAAAMGIGVAAVVAILYGLLLPRLQPIRVSERVAELLRRDGAADQRVVMIDYKEPSLAFYQGGGCREADDGYLQTTPPSQWPEWVVLTRTEWDKLPEAIRDRLQVLGDAKGINYAGAGKAVDVMALRVKG